MFTWFRDRLDALSGWGACYRCGASWRRVKGHQTWYREGRACFPLCECCWASLTPEERLPFYRALFAHWQTHGATASSEKWLDIERAVLAGG